MMRLTRTLAAVAAVLVVGTGLAAPAGAAPAAPRPSGHSSPAGCAHAAHRGQAICHAAVWTSAVAPQADAPPAGALGPAQIQQAYDLPTGAGGGQTVAIVDAYGASTAEADLAQFRQHYGLPACTTANGCFRKVDQRGGTDYPADDAGWGLETALDLDAVSAACPQCNILLVEGDSSNTDDLGAAVCTAVSLGAKYVSNSYGVPGEFAQEVDADGDYSHAGVAVVASTGDTGNVTNWPASNPDVVAVGGTSLRADAGSARGWTETAWADGGSGCSPYEPKPDYQRSVTTGCDRRAIADIAADADPATGLAVYDTLGQSGWVQVGGTSLAAPLVAGMYALAGPAPAGAFPVADLYSPAHAGQFNDVTGGSNGACGTVLCTAGAGWDGPTGVGTPDGVAGLQQGPHGTVRGTVTDASTHAPIGAASVTLSDGEQTRTAADGTYALSGVPVGRYTVTAAEYGYASKTSAQLTVTDGGAVTANLALQPVPLTTVSGRVRDSSAHHFPLYARIDIPGYPDGGVFTDPATGRYSVRLPSSSTYAVTVTPFGAGYTPVTRTLTVGTGQASASFGVPVDATSCQALGYGWDGATTDFTGWSRVARSGWTVTGSPGWRFDNPAGRMPPDGGDQTFAVADATYAGGALTSALTSPSIDLSGQHAPRLSFDSRYLGAPGSRGTVAISRDGGATWRTLWTRTSRPDAAPVSLALPAATVRVRFAFAATAGGVWGIDDVYAGSHTCIARPGGVVTGQVADDAGPLPGALVYDSADAAHPATAVATPDDPAVGEAYYALFVPAGVRTVRAAASGHPTATARLSIADGAVLTHDWTLS